MMHNVYGVCLEGRFAAAAAAARYIDTYRPMVFNMGPTIK